MREGDYDETNEKVSYVLPKAALKNDFKKHIRTTTLMGRGRYNSPENLSSLPTLDAQT
jgi:hypothetical protein